MSESEQMHPNAKQQRYLISETNGRVFLWTPALHERKDMRLATEAEANRALAALNNEAAARVEAALNPKPQEGDDDGQSQPQDTFPLPTIDDIIGLTDKLHVEELGRKFGFEADRRKGLKTLQSELITHLGLTVD